MRAEAGEAFPDVPAACAALSKAEACWQEAALHQENLWTQEKEVQMLQRKQACLRKPLELKAKELETMETSCPLHCDSRQP